ncbi:hypothetical protein BCT01_02590 [Vibrio tasmaniensis]|uniref:hypothetical protein n=1 Tax=Vibrio tasmaniensis TaxID=212663 RepID=UPI000C83BB97|nr:hypothetical protein [Vibrio tasmaniensis]PMO85938.1 hypothetical protein BCT01_02590 [Vibrio tasmaniensis]
MKFILDKALFTTQNKVNLQSLLYNALRNRAYIEFDIDDEDILAWISVNDLEQWTIAHDTFISDEANYQLNNYVYVRDGLISSDWNSAIPNITLDDACDLITCPLQIWVENSRNDGDFFRLFLSPTSRQHLDTLIELGRVKFESKGGIGEMKAVLTQNPTELGFKNKRFIVYDSDAPVPNALQPDAIVIKNTCNAHGIKHHAWSRRSIENYLPVQYLIDQIHINVRPTSSDVKKYNAFLSMSTDQQHHFHMKKGMYDSTCFDSPLFQSNQVYQTLNIEDLWEGFSGRFANKFLQKINHSDATDIRSLMQANDSNNELSSVEQALFQYIRVPV